MKIHSLKKLGIWIALTIMVSSTGLVADHVEFKKNHAKNRDESSSSSKRHHHHSRHHGRSTSSNKHCELPFNRNSRCAFQQRAIATATRILGNLNNIFLAQFFNPTNPNLPAFINAQIGNPSAPGTIAQAGENLRLILLELGFPKFN